MIPKFSMIINAINDESITEARFGYHERDDFKRMFDGL
jgi:hypothetical protein